MQLEEPAVPFLDLGAQMASLRGDVDAAIRRVLDRHSFILGPELQAFERDFARFCETTHAVGVANGTDAIELALRAVGIEPGDEVITCAHTFVASALGIERAGGQLVLVDCEPESFGLSPERAIAATTARTKAILPVHLYGQPACLERLFDFCERRGITIVEDAAQAHGACLHGRSVGGLGKTAAFSFYPGKNLGALGDGGAVTTNDPACAARLEAMRNYGSPRKYHHPTWGTNSRLDEVQAAVLSVKLAKLADWNAARARAAARYDDLLAHLASVKRPSVREGATHAWHLYVIRVPRRDEVLARMNAAGIAVAVHYPTPIHLHGAMSHLGKGPGSFPEAERACAEVLSLPLFPEITLAQQERVARALETALR